MRNRAQVPKSNELQPEYNAAHIQQARIQLGCCTTHLSEVKQRTKSKANNATTLNNLSTMQ